MTTVPELRDPAVRLRIATRLGARRLGLRALALAGDPVARLLGGSSDDLPTLHRRIRARGPVWPSRTGTLVVSGRELCDRVLRDPRFGLQLPDGSPAGYDRLDQLAQGPLTRSFLELDPPDHTRLRRLAAPAFRPKMVRGYAGRVEAVAHRLLDGLAGRDPVDLVADFAAPLPIAVISDLLGIPEGDRARFARIGMLVGASLDGITSLRQAYALREASDELAALFRRLSAARRAAPGDDVISLLTTAADGGGLDGQELVSTCGLLLVAGFETTVNLVGNATAALLSHREEWDRLVADPSRAARVAEETLRYDAPVQLTMRIAQDDVELAGHPVPAGRLVLLVLGAANRDPAAYREPDRFDPGRTGEPDHLAFSSGIHYCLGAPLARLEGEVALRALATRLPGLHRAPGARRRPGSTIRGFATFPVRPGSPPAPPPPRWTSSPMS